MTRNFDFYWWAMQKGLSPMQMVYLLLRYIDARNKGDDLQKYCFKEDVTR